MPEAASIPRTLRVSLADVRLPAWLRDAAALPENASLQALEPSLVESRLRGLGRRLDLYLWGLLRTRMRRLTSVPVVDGPHPSELTIGDVPCSARTARLLRDAGLAGDSPLAGLTFGALFAVRRLGPRGILDFAVEAERAADDAHRCNGWPRELDELRRRLSAVAWADLVTREDPRFGDLFDPANGSSPPDAALPEMFARIDRIERCPLDEGLRQYVSALSGVDDVRLAGVLARLGLDGRPPRSLAHAANASGVSWERVRQLEQRVTSRVLSHPVYLPMLDRALKLVAELAPVQADQAADALRASGLSTVPFHPESLLAAARLCGREPTFAIEQTRKGDWVIEATPVVERRPLVRLASRYARRFGAVSLDRFLAAARASGIRLTEAQARHVLTQHCGASFLDGQWFWLPESRRDRIEELTHRILAVSSPLDVWTIRGGLARAYPVSQRNDVPPAGVLEGFYRAHPSFDVDAQGRIGSAVVVDRRVLGKWDRVFIEVLRSSPTGLLDRRSFRRACLLRGMTPQTFAAGVTSSVVLNHVAHNEWCLRGTAVDQAVAPSAALIPTITAPASETAASEVAKLVPKKRHRGAAGAINSKSTTTSATTSAAS